MNKKFLYALLLMHAAFSATKDLKDINSNINLAKATIRISKTAFQAIGLAQETVSPNDEQKLNKDRQEELEKIKAAEDKLKQCLADNAYAKRQEGELPTECDSFDQLFSILAGFERRNALKKEFNDIIAALPAQNKKEATYYSTRKVIIIGGVAFVVVGGALFFLAPVIVPGTIIASKATAVIAAIKGTSVAAGTKVASAVLTSKAAIVSAVLESKEIFVKQTWQENIITINNALSAVEEVCAQADAYGYDEEDSEEKSLQERIVEKHFN